MPVVDGVATVTLPARPGRVDLDPVLAQHGPGRIVVHGTDADLAAVVLRLLRTDRLDVEVAYLATERGSAVVAIWGLPSGPAAVALAVDGRAQPAPLVRDDTGGALVGRAEIRNLRGECWCDDTLVLRGTAPRLVVAPGPAGIAVRAGRSSRLPDGAPAPSATGPGSGGAVGRAVQVGGAPFAVTADGQPHPRPLERRTWYRHTTDWLLVRA